MRAGSETVLSSFNLGSLSVFQMGFAEALLDGLG